MKNQELEQMQNRIDILTTQLRQARLEYSVYSNGIGAQPIEGLAEHLNTEFHSDYLLLVIFHARADRSNRHTFSVSDPSPALQSNNPRPVVYYTGPMQEQTEALCRKHISPRSTYILFRADTDLGLLLCPDGRYVSDANISSGNYLQEIRTQIDVLLSDMDQAFSFETTATASRLWKERVDLRRMYLDNKDAYDYSWNKPGKFYTYDELCTVSMSSGDRMLLCSLEEEFSNDATHMLFEEAAVVLGNILDMMLRHTIPLADIKTSATARLRNILTVLDYNGGVTQEIADHLTLLLQKVSASASIPELQDRIFDFFAALNGLSPSVHAKKSVQILEFIEANSKNPGLNAEMICDRFRISRTYLSRLIKRETGFGLVDAIHKARLVHAKVLLRDTDLTSEQIAQQVGFTNRYGLIRAFRNQENITPAEYRAKYIPKSE